MRARAGGRSPFDGLVDIVLRNLWHHRLMKTLWEQLGGHQNMERIINDFVDHAIANPAVNYTRNGRYALDEKAIQFSKKSALEFFSAATGGPLQYSGRSIVDIHRNMQISNSEFDAICEDIRRSLERNGIGVSLQDVVMAKVEATRPLIVDPKFRSGFQS
jgi:hemoglobin